MTVSNHAAPEVLRCLIPIQAGGGPPIYCFHAFSGSPAPYGNLASRLGRDRAVYGVQAAGLTAGVEPDRTVLDMVARYARDIAATTPPDGQCVFLGYSFGGVLAVECARLLTYRLDRPPLVIAVDADPTYHTAGAVDAWAILVHQVLNLDLPVERLPTLERHEALATVRAAAAAQRKLPARFGLDHLGRMFDVCLANEQAAARHRPQPYPGRVVSLRSSDPAAVVGPDTWTGIAADLVVRRVPGDHHSLMSPAGYPELARQIRLLLAEPAGGTA